MPKPRSTTIPSPISTREYAARRQTLAKQLGDAAAIVLAGDGSRASVHFRYLTGLGDEHGGAVLFDPSH